MRSVWAKGISLLLVCAMLLTGMVLPISAAEMTEKNTMSTIPLKKVGLYSYISSTGDTVGEQVTACCVIPSPQGMAAGVITLDYDANLLMLTGVRLGTALQSANGAIWSVEDSLPGRVVISYASLSGLTSYIDDAVTATFEIIENEDTVTEINIAIKEVYDFELSPVEGGSTRNMLTLRKLDLQPQIPTISVDSYAGSANEFEIGIHAEGETSLAAGDFVVTYDPDLLYCRQAVGSTENCMVIANILQEEGKVKFSFICEDGISKDTELIRLTFARKSELNGTSQIGLQVSNPVDAQYETVKVEIVPGKIEGIPVLAVLPGDLNGDGNIDTTDVVCLRRYIAGGYGVTIHEKAADVNVDGILQTTDVVLIRRFIAGGYGVELKSVP